MTISYCGETVRKNDPDRFLLSLFAPASLREALWSLYVFNHEIAKTREVVTETQLGLIRLQWWRDEIAKIYTGQVSKHQVLEPLAEAIRAHSLPRELFDNLVYAREFDLEDRQPSGIEGLVNYADFTSTPLLKLSLLVLDRTCDEGAVKNIATAYALTGLLRAAPFHLSQRRCYLPVAGMAEELYAGRGLEKLQGVAKAVAEEAQNLLSVIPVKAGIYPTDRAMDSRLRGNDRWVHLHVKLAQMYLDQIKSAGYDLLSTKLKAPPFLREARLWVHSL